MKVNLFGIFWHSDNNSNAETGGGEKKQHKTLSALYLSLLLSGNIKCKLIENIIL